jgi:cytosine/adenosine deaminase-related metal-dependent hydrolase
VRKIGASLIFSLSGPVLENGFLEVDESGCITSLGLLSELPGTKGIEFYEGILVPGFVNAHVHLELSHLKGKVKPGKGMGHFIGEINRLRAARAEEIFRSAAAAEVEMLRQGIVAAGDIVNTTDTIELKKENRLEWITFVETFGFHPSRAEKAIGEARRIRRLFQEAGLAASIVPHSPYSVSKELFGEIRKLKREECSILSMHNQESKDEMQLFHTGDGPILEHITNNLGIDASHWTPSGISPLETVLPLMPEDVPLLLVHNTYTTKNDIHQLKLRQLKQTAKLKGENHPVWMVLCPNSNLYIGKTLPPVGMLKSEGMNLCLGTDSLASNEELSILSEIKTLQRNFPGIPTGEFFAWASRNGAQALGISARYGTFDNGKKPGVLLISPVDLKNGALLPESRVQRLI